MFVAADPAIHHDYAMLQNGTKAVQLALAAAKVAGGGVVLLPIGKLFIDGALVIPPHTTLKGTSQELSTLYFLEDGIGRQLGGLSVAEGGCKYFLMSIPHRPSGSN